MIIIKSAAKGIGKSTLTEYILYKIIGSRYAVKGSINIFNDSFNGQLFNKLFYLIDEAPNFDEKSNIEEKMKTLIT